MLVPGNSAVYIFTDASSKDCIGLQGDITRYLKHLHASAFFILFDSCQTKIDPIYVKIADSTNGFCLLVRGDAVYNITDTIHGAFSIRAMVVGEDSAMTSSNTGQGISHFGKMRGKRALLDNIDNVHLAQKTILVDDLMQTFKVYVTIAPEQLLDQVSLYKPVNLETQHLCSELEITKSMADNGVIFNVEARSCPCVGNWTLTYPSSASFFSFAVKSIGEYTLSFEAYFVDEIDGNRVSNYAPCVGVEEYLIIKLNQGEHVRKESLVAKLVGAMGNKAFKTVHLEIDSYHPNTYVVKVFLPTDIGSGGFWVVLEGELLGGSRFQRRSGSIFKPSTFCFRVKKVNNYYALFPSKKTLIKVEVSNFSPVDNMYSILCHNTLNYRVTLGEPVSIGPVRHSIKGNPFSLHSGGRVAVNVIVSAPRSLRQGRVVHLFCTVRSSTGVMTEIVSLTEMAEKFYD